MTDQNDESRALATAPEARYLVTVAVAGACDRFGGRPRDRNPYDGAYARACLGGWDNADFYLAVQGEREAANWLREVS
jgi:hypothetical protein